MRQINAVLTVAVVAALVATLALAHGHHHEHHHHNEHKHEQHEHHHHEHEHEHAHRTALRPPPPEGPLIPVEEHKCVHDTEVVPLIEREDAEYAKRGTTRPIATYGKPAHAHERDAHVMAVGPLRVVVRTTDLYTAGKFCSSATGTSSNMQGGTIACSADTVLTSAKISLLINTMLPAAISSLQKAISVNQATGNIIVPAGACSYFTVPAADSTTGVANADFVLYVSAAPTSGNTVAWAGYCSLDANGRPVVGRMNFSPKYIVWNTSQPNEVAKTKYTTMHELTHALGFSSSLFLKAPRTTTYTTRGKTVTAINSATVLSYAKTYFGCSTMTGVELEDQGGTGTAGSHWERRNLRDEFMAGMTGYPMRMSVFTLALLQDSGKYTINFGAADSMFWANNTKTGLGCGFLTGTANLATAGQGAYINNRPGLWCKATNQSMCSPDRRWSGYCSWNTYTTAITPSYFAQFSPTTTGGSSGDLMDFAPWVNAFSNRICDNPGQTASQSDIVMGWTFSTQSRCLATNNLIQTGYVAQGAGARCLDVRCPTPTTVQVRIRGGSWLSCPANGGAGAVAATGGYGGTIYCPAAKDICPDL